jgi:hypothetical protein
MEQAFMNIRQLLESRVRQHPDKAFVIFADQVISIAADFERRFHLTVLETYGLSECPMGTSNLATMRTSCARGMPVACRADTVPGWRLAQMRWRCKSP